MQITFPALASLNVAVNLAYNTAFQSAPDVSKPWTDETTSTGAAETYPRLDLIGGIREWTGNRVIEELSLSSFEIRNKAYEKTISVKRWDLEDDRFHVLSGVAAQIGMLTANFRPLKVTQTLLAGTTTPTWDGQSFFSTSHPNPTDAPPGAAGVGTVPNYQAGAAAPWFLFDTRWAQKAIIWQTRDPFKVVPLFSMTDPSVFNFAEFLWGLDGRNGCGLGMWQYAFMSNAALTAANITAARTAMASIQRPDGTPMGIIPDVLVCGTDLFANADMYATGPFLPTGDPAVVSGNLTPNPVRAFKLKVLENLWLN